MISLALVLASSSVKMFFDVSALSSSTFPTAVTRKQCLFWYVLAVNDDGFWNRALVD